MPVVSANYWNNIHGFVAEDAMQDLEGLQTLRNLAINMTAMLKNQHREGAFKPERDTTKVHTNFIR